MNTGSKSAMRRNAVILLVIAIALVLGSMWINMVLKKSALKDIPDIERTAPDYTVENFRYFRFLNDGTPQYEAIGKKLTHYPSNDIYKIEDPLVFILGEQKQLQTIKANDALIEDFNTKIHLSNNVEMEEEGIGNKAAKKLNTQYLLIYPDEEIATTDKAVKIVQGKNTMTGIGMTANSATKELEMHGRVHITLYPNGDKVTKPVSDKTQAQYSSPLTETTQPPQRIKVQLD